MGAVSLSVLSLKPDRDFFHFRIASVEEFLVAFAEAIERGCPVNYRLTLASASAAAERIPMTFLAFVVSMSRNCDELLCHISANKLLKRIVIDVSKLPFIKNVKVAWENASVAFDDRVASANTRHRAVFGRSAEKHSYVVVKIADADRMTRTEILVIFVEGDLQEFRVTLGCE